MAGFDFMTYFVKLPTLRNTETVGQNNHCSGNVYIRPINFQFSLLTRSKQDCEYESTSVFGAGKGKIVRPGETGPYF